LITNFGVLVEILHKNLKIPVFCKMRILDSHERTIEYAKMFEDAGCQLLTVHGRTKEQRGQNQGLANWDMIRDIKFVSFFFTAYKPWKRN
jgi:tRNA-dihydrouridine synthase 1